MSNNKERQKGQGTPVHLTGDSTLQSPQEDRHDKSIDPRKDSTISITQEDPQPAGAKRNAGSDRQQQG